MEQRFILRLAEIDDIPSIMEIEQICFDKDSFSKRQFVYLISQAKGYFCVAEYQQRVGGYFSVLINQRACSLRIYSIAVHPDFRQKHVGEALLTAIIDECYRNMAKYITLEVRVGNKPAIGLYEKYGFKSLGTRKGYYQDNNEDALIMWTENIFYDKFKLGYEKNIADLKGKINIL